LLVLIYLSRLSMDRPAAGGSGRRNFFIEIFGFNFIYAYLAVIVINSRNKIIEGKIMITIYVTGWCPYCNAARRLLREKKLEYEVIDIEKEGISRDQLVKITGGRSVPQIMIDGKSIGGYGELMALDLAGKLPAPRKE